jgi:hypothetical protein
MTGLDPSRTGGFPIEVETAASAHAAVTRPGTFERRLGRPCEGALFNGKEGEPGDDLVNREEALLRSPIIRRCGFISHS